MGHFIKTTHISFGYLFLHLALMMTLQYIFAISSFYSIITNGNISISFVSIHMVALLCHHFSDNYVDFSDLFVVLSDPYVDMSVIYSLRNKFLKRVIAQLIHIDNKTI